MEDSWPCGNAIGAWVVAWSPRDVDQFRLQRRSSIRRGGGWANYLFSSFLFCIGSGFRVKSFKNSSMDVCFFSLVKRFCLFSNFCRHGPLNDFTFFWLIFEIFQNLLGRFLYFFFNFHHFLKSPKNAIPGNYPKIKISTKNRSELNIPGKKLNNSQLGKIKKKIHWKNNEKMQQKFQKNKYLGTKIIGKN